MKYSSYYTFDASVSVIDKEYLDQIKKKVKYLFLLISKTEKGRMASALRYDKLDGGMVNLEKYIESSEYDGFKDLLQIIVLV